MRSAGRLRAAVTALVAVACVGCAQLPFFGADRGADAGSRAPAGADAASAASRSAGAGAPSPTGAAASATAASGAAASGATASGSAAASEPAPEAPAAYALDVDAPEPLRTLLLDNLDLARFQRAPATDSVEPAELERLVRVAPAQVRELLETEGYFNAEVDAARTDDDGGRSRVRIHVAPGPRTVVATLNLDAEGPLQAAAAAGDPAARRELEALRSQWPLAAGRTFRQADWSSGKVSTLARLRSDGYATATWRRTDARIDAVENRAELSLVLDSGPLFRLGAIRIEGLERYDAESVRRLATFDPGDPYREQALLDFQDRLQKLGLFETASVTLEADPANAAAAPVVVRVREQTRQQATFGIGYSANTGPRFSVEHTDRGVLGTRWVAHSKLELGPLNRTVSSELTSFPLPNLYRNLVSGSYSNLLVEDQKLNSWDLRAGRAQSTTTIDRLYYAELAHARLDSDALSSSADAASLNANWIFRDLDNLLLPTRGLTTSLQVGAGEAHGTRSVDNAALESAHGPFARLYARLTWYRPIGANWFGTARLEGGQVLTRSAVGIPDTLLFRAGGQDSVRGYAYRELGPSIAGVTISGRALATASVELARPIVASLPALWGAVFVDAGNAADSFGAWKPALGYGVGVRYRSPVGPLRIDLAYGQDDRRVRLHFSVGVTF